MNILKKIFGRTETKKDVIVNNIISVIKELSQTSASINAGSIGFQAMINYYTDVHPLAHALDIISDEFANINILIEDENGEFESNHDVLTLLRNPNQDLSGVEFRKSLALFYTLIGNTFLDAVGNVDFEPSQLNILYPQAITIEQSTIDGYAEFYDYNSFAQKIKYKRTDTDKGQRFYESNKLNELWHMKKFNPNGASDVYGAIPQSSLLQEIEQYARSSNHNLSLLKNGARLSAMLIKEGMLTDEQYYRLKQQINENYQGDNNAGKVILTESGDGKMDLKELSQTNRDMDFKDNKKDVKLAIYAHNKIPLPLVSPDHMTMSNYTEANLSLYDNAVLPVTDAILNQLTLFLFPRYKDLEGKKLSYNPNDISALQARFNQDIKLKKETGSFTDNEIRALAEYDPIDGGDLLYQPMNLIPIGSSESFEPQAPKEKFAEILKKNGYSEDNVKKAINKFYKD